MMRTIKKYKTLCVSMAVFLSLFQIPAAAQNLEAYEGKITNVLVGNDSISIELGNKHFLIGPSTDGYPEAYRELQTSWPSILDVGSTVKIVSARGLFLDFMIIRRPSHLWLSISGSYKAQRNASAPSTFQSLKRNLINSGCSTEILHTDSIPNLKMGYFIVASGGFTSLDQAKRCLQKSKQLGIRDAYIRQIF